MSQTERHLVKMTSRQPGYAGNEICAWEPDQAKTLVEKGVAKYCDHEGKASTKPVPALRRVKRVMGKDKDGRKTVAKEGHYVLGGSADKVPDDRPAPNIVDKKGAVVGKLKTSPVDKEVKESEKTK